MASKCSLVIQSFGKKSEYLRAVFTIWSFFAYSSAKKEDVLILLFTDKPGFFESYLSSLPVEYVLLTDEKIKALRGEIDFLHYMKIGIIEEAFNRKWGNVIYCDSDTFFISDPKPYLDKVSGDKCFMHLREYCFKEIDQNNLLPNQPAMFDFLQAIESQKFYEPGGGIIDVNLNKASWNAGVMIFGPEHSSLLPRVYSLTEQFYKLSKCHAAEQFAFSVALQNNLSVLPCQGMSYHYWYRVKKQVMDVFLSEKLSDSWAKQEMEDKIQSVKESTELLPDYFESHILMLRDKAIQSFNTNDFKDAYSNTLKAFVTDPSDFQFIRDVLYHTRRLLIK